MIFCICYIISIIETKLLCLKKKNQPIFKSKLLKVLVMITQALEYILVIDAILIE